MAAALVGGEHACQKLSARQGRLLLEPTQLALAGLDLTSPPQSAADRSNNRTAMHDGALQVGAMAA